MASQYKANRKIFLHTFQPVPHVYNICPFGIKLESFLRINDIPYEAVFSGKFGSKGMIPYIRFDDPDVGDEFPDSNAIISTLIQQGDVIKSETDLTPAQRATTHMLIRMLEEHTIQIHFYYRYGLNMDEFLDVLDIENRFRPGLAKMWGKFQPSATKDKTKYRGLSRHSDEELWGFSNDDIQSISDYLGNGPYFFGERPTLMDCAVFGHLSQIMWIPMDFPQKKYIEENCPNLVSFMERFRDKYWPDWEELSATMVSRKA